MVTQPAAGATQSPAPIAFRSIDPSETLARLRSARSALGVCTASIEATVGDSIENLDMERDLLECLGSRREAFMPAEAWIERQRRDSVALMTGRAHAILHGEGVYGMEQALARGRQELHIAKQTWGSSLVR